MIFKLAYIKFCIDTRDKNKWSNITHYINIQRFMTKFIKETRKKFHDNLLYDDKTRNNKLQT